MTVSVREKASERFLARFLSHTHKEGRRARESEQENASERSLTLRDKEGERARVNKGDQETEREEWGRKGKKSVGGGPELKLSMGWLRLVGS